MKLAARLPFPRASYHATSWDAKMLQQYLLSLSLKCVILYFHPNMDLLGTDDYAL